MLHTVRPWPEANSLLRLLLWSGLQSTWVWAHAYDVFLFTTTPFFVCSMFFSLLYIARRTAARPDPTHRIIARSSRR